MGVPSFPFYFAGQIETESCITLRHSRCWNPSSKLQTPKELGVGLGQITKTYTRTGAIRFDALQELKSIHPKELKEMSWSTIEKRPDLQILAIILKMRDNYQHYIKYKVPIYNSIIFAIESYNEGVGGLDNERRACVLTKGCDPNIWFGNVEKLCLKSKAALYGKRSACDISREYPVKVLQRSTKYKKYFL